MKIQTLFFLSTLLFSLNALQISKKLKSASSEKQVPCVDPFDPLCANPASQTPTYTISGYLENALTGQIISGANLTSLRIVVTFTSSRNQVYTASVDVSRSVYTVTLPAGVYVRNGTLDTYISAVTNVNITGNSTETNLPNSIVLSPIFQGWRAVVNWNGNVDKDLDSYTKCPDQSFVYYKVKNSADHFVNLDTDSRNSGPETMSYTFTEASNGVWSYFVTSYTKTAPMTQNQAKVVVYHGATQVAELMVPTTGASNAWWWHVFDLKVNANVQNYVLVNTLTTTMV